MKRCVVKYETVVEAIAGRLPRICHAETPFLPSETKVARWRAPNKSDGRNVECSTCLDSFLADMIRDKFTCGVKGKERPIRKILPMIEKWEVHSRT